MFNLIYNANFKENKDDIKIRLTLILSDLVECLNEVDSAGIQLIWPTL